MESRVSLFREVYSNQKELFMAAAGCEAHGLGWLLFGMLDPVWIGLTKIGSRRI